MLEKLLEKSGRFIVTHRLWVVVIAAWVVLGIGALVLAPSLTDVGVMDEASFLPEGSGYWQAKEALKAKFPDQVAEGQGLLVFYDPLGLDDERLAYAEELAAWLSSPQGPAEVEQVVSIFDKPELEGTLISEDGQAMLMQVDFTTQDYSAETNEAVAAIRSRVAETAPAGMEVYLTGPAAMGKDMLGAVLEGTGKTTLVAIFLVIVVLLLIYRSPVGYLVPLTTIGLAYLVARGLLGFLAGGGIAISSLLDSLLIVLIFGVGTDYALFLISRFREEMGRGNGQSEALVRTVTRIGPVITASAGTVIVGMLGMMVASFGMTRTNGPAMALGIAITLLAALSLTPALLQLSGRWLFWPFHRNLSHERIGEGLINWKKIGRFVTSRPLLTALVVVVVLLLPYPAWLQMNSTFNILGEIPEAMDSSRGFAVLADHFAAGEMAPLSVIVTSPQGNLLEPGGLRDIARVTQALQEVDGVDGVRSAVQPTGDAEISAMFRVDGQLATMVDQVLEMLTALADPTQLAALASEQDPAAAFTLLQDYLDEVGERYPDVRDDAHYQDAVTTLDDFAGRMVEMTDLLQVDKQLATMADTVEGMTASLSDPQALAEMVTPGEKGNNPFSGMEILGQYLTELGAAYPDIRTDPAFGSAVERLRRLGETMSGIQEQMSVAGQLTMMAAQLRQMGPMLASPVGLAMAASQGTEQFRALGGYFAELGKAFPEVQENPAYGDALAQLKTLSAVFEKVQQAQAAGQAIPAEEMAATLAAIEEAVNALAGDLGALQELFVGRTDLVFLPSTMPLPAEAMAKLQAMQEEVAGLAGDLRTLSQGFAGKRAFFAPTSLMQQEESAAALGEAKAEVTRLADDLGMLAETFAGQEAYLIPEALLQQTPELAELLSYFFAADRTATQLTVLLKGDPYSLEAIDTVDRIQKQLDVTLAYADGGENAGYKAYVGGVTVMVHDVQRTVGRDFGKVQVVVVAGVFLVFVLLLRSLVAPIYLVLSVILSYGTTMGLCTLLFQNVLGYGGVNYLVPIIIFVLVVALGADYNIFLMSRVKEESEKTKDVREGVRLASTYTGGIITSCGIILAGTFGALALSPIKMLSQIGVAIAIGVLVDTFIVRSLLVPAVAALLGKWNWWPFRT